MKVFFMKQAVNFRLSNQAMTALSRLEDKMHISKTVIVEEALQLYAKKILFPQGKLFEFAGILSDKEADMLLDVIKSNKINKDLKVDL
jgi:hypothetical protein